MDPPLLIITANGFQRGNQSLNLTVNSNADNQITLTGNQISKGDVSIQIPTAKSLILTGDGIGVGDSNLQLFPNDDLITNENVHFTIPAGQVISGIKPPGVNNLKVRTANPTQIDMEWDPVQFVQISGYTIERKFGSGDWATLITISSDQTTYSDKGLNSGTFYYRVSAANTVGTGPPSNDANATTAFPPGKPTALRATTLSGTRIRLEWTAPEWDGGAPITAYKIERSYDDLSWPTEYTVVTQDNGTSYESTGLQKDTLYYYRVSAKNDIGASNPPSDSVSTRTWKQPSIPSGVSATSNTDGVSATVTFTGSDNNGGSEITAYVAYAYLVGGTNDTDLPSGILYMPSPNLSIQVDELTRGSIYEFKVVARNIVGDSDPSAESSQVLVAQVPGQPTSVTSSQVNLNNATVSFGAPLDNGGSSILSYKVKVCIITANNTEEYSKTVSWTRLSDLTVPITELAGGITYRFKVFAVNGMGDGDLYGYSDLVMKNSPSFPDLMVEAISDTQISLSWTQPASDAPIQGYLIERSGNGSDWSSLVSKDDQYTQTTYTNNALTSGQLYYYRVAAFSFVGTGTFSSSVSDRTWTLPSEPQFVSATSNEDGVSANVTFDEPLSNGDSSITYYVAYAYLVGGDASSEVRSATLDMPAEQLSVDITGLIRGQKYKFKVLAHNGVGDGPLSAESSEVLVAQRPGRPTLTSVAQSGLLTVRVNFTAPADNGGSDLLSYTASAFELVNGNESFARSETLVLPAVAPLSINVGGLETGKTYVLKVVATNARGDSLFSTTTSQVTAQVLMKAAPGAPTLTSIFGFSDSQVNLKWTAPTISEAPVSGYKIERSLDNSEWSTVVANTNSTSITYSDTGLTHNTLYYYRVSGVSIAGPGVPSDVLSATTETRVLYMTTLNEPYNTSSSSTAMVRDAFQFSTTTTAVISVIRLKFQDGDPAAYQVTIRQNTLDANGNDVWGPSVGGFGYTSSADGFSTFKGLAYLAKPGKYWFDAQMRSGWPGSLAATTSTGSTGSQAGWQPIMKFVNIRQGLVGYTYGDIVQYYSTATKYPLIEMNGFDGGPTKPNIEVNAVRFNTVAVYSLATGDNTEFAITGYRFYVFYEDGTPYESYEDTYLRMEISTPNGRWKFKVSTLNARGESPLSEYGPQTWVVTSNEFVPEISDGVLE